MLKEKEIMESKHAGFGQRVLSLVLLLMVFVAFTCMAQDGETPQKEWEDFDPTNFDNPTKIDNQWFPLKPGMQLAWEGTTIDDEGEAIPHRVVFVVTDLAKVIGGVRTVVCWDQDYSDDQLEETELVFFAQDNDGNVWHLGQYPEEYDEGELIAAPCWLHGFEDSYAGIMMKANPQLNTPSYSQGWGPAVDWTDRAMTHQMGQKTEVPFGSYEDVLVIKEWAKGEPGFQLKYYARGVGNIRVGFLGEEERTKETLELVEFKQLDAKALAEVRKEALKLEKSAYENSKNVYARTAPAEQPSKALGKK
jgi:hypothetical protein